MSDARDPVDVTIFLQDLRGGGAERAFLRLARGMIAAGRTVEIVLVGPRNDYPNEVPPEARIVHLGTGRVLRAIPAFARHLKRTQPRAVLSALTHVNVAAIIAHRLSGISAPMIVSERNQFSAKTTASSNFADRVAYWLAPKLYRRAHKVVCVSEGVAEDVRAVTGLSDTHCIAIHNPSFDPAAVSRAVEAPGHDWFAEAEGRPETVVAIGRLDPQKGFDTLVDAFAALRHRRPARLAIFGEGAERADLEARAEAAGLTAESFALPGFTTNPFALMARADLFVLSSRYEGFPNVLVEAMACGAPVVATNCPSGPNEIFSPETVSQLVDVDDAEGLAVAMERELADPANRETLKARAALFSVDVASKKYMEVLGI
ncbi:MAG: glycosyltransferase [Pseudomonadota bacterium]